MTWQLSAFADEAGEMVDQQIAALTEARINLVDLRLVDGINISVLPLQHAREVAAKLRGAGIGVGMFGSPIGKIDILEDFGIDAEKLEHLAKLREPLGCNRVRIFSYFNKKNADLRTWQSIALDRLAKLMEMAQKLDLVLYHENEHLIFGDHLAQVREIRDQIRAADPARFRMIFDFDNFNQAGDDVWENWLELRDSTDAIHFKDSKKDEQGNFQHVPAGLGDGHVKRIIQDAAARGWQGPLTLEPHLAHSKAVMATGPSGKGYTPLASMSTHESFVYAAGVVRQLLRDVDRMG